MNEEIDDEENYSLTPEGIAVLADILETEKVPDKYLGLPVLNFLILFVIATGGQVPLPESLKGREDLEDIPLREMPGVIEQLKKALLASVP